MQGGAIRAHPRGNFAEQFSIHVPVDVPTIFSGLTHCSNCSAVTYPSSVAACFSVVLSVLCGWFTAQFETTVVRVALLPFAAFLLLFCVIEAVCVYFCWAGYKALPPGVAVA